MMFTRSTWKTDCYVKRMPLLAVAFSLLTLTNLSTAADVKFNAGVTARLVDQKVETQTEDNADGFDVTNRIVRPFASVDINSRKVNLQARATNEYINRNLNDNSISTSYPEYNVNGRYQAIDNLLSFNASGTQRYQSQRLQSFNVDDFLLNEDNLNKITTTRFGSQFNLSRGEYFGLDLSGTYNKSEADFDGENNNFTNNQFNNEGYSGAFNLISGKSLKEFRSVLDGSANYVKRGNNQNFRSQRANLSNNLYIYNNLGIVANGSYENNEIESALDDSTNPGLREFYSAGIGLFWRSAENRYIEIAYNESTTEGLNNIEDERNNFFSYQLNWAFSSRTSIQGNLTRRFFGNAGNFSFRHNLRNWRSSITYRESVNSTSQLISVQEQGLFICENGIDNLSQCSLSDSLTPNIEDGEFLVPVNLQSFEVNDRVVLRKGLTAQTAVTRRRTTLSVLASKTEIDEFEIDRNVDTSTFQTQASFEVSAKTTAQLTYRFLDVESRRDNADFLRQITNEYSARITRRLTRSFSTSIAIRYLNRQGETDRLDNQFRGLNGPLTDRRITLGLTYTFGDIGN